MSFPTQRLRRLRRTEPLRRLVQETRLTPEELVYPLFVVDQRGRPIEMHVDSIDTYYTYLGDHLIERRVVADRMHVDSFQYDAGGNVAIWRGDQGGHENYDNSCW